MIETLMLTSAGKALLAKIPLGQTAPVTRWQLGTGSLPKSGSLDRTHLIKPFTYLPISSVEQADDTCTVLGQFSNLGRPEFKFEELGLLAQDPEKGEILLCYGNDSEIAH